MKTTEAAEESAVTSEVVAVTVVIAVEETGKREAGVAADPRLKEAPTTQLLPRNNSQRLK